MKRTLYCLLLLGVSSIGQADTFLHDGLYYSITSDNTVKVVAASTTSGGSTIGFGFGGGYEGDVIIPQTVTYGGVSYTVSEVESGTFSESPKLTSVSLPSTVLSLGETPFAACSQFKEVNVDENNPVYHSDDGVLYNKEQTRIITCPAMKTGAFEIPPTVTEIASSAFYGCQYLTEISIPSTIRTIGVYAFRGCSRLSEAVLPDGVEVISKGAFQECRRLTSVSLPQSMTRVEDMAFYYCQSLSSVELPVGLRHLGRQAFRNCSSLSSCAIPETVDTIAEYAFAYCENLKSLHLPASVKYVGACVVTSCSSLLDISIDDSNPYYQVLDGILYNKEVTLLVACPGAKTGEVDIPATVIGIEDLAFSSCMKLTQVHLPVSVKKIGYAAFSGCHGLQSLTIPCQVEEIGQYAFTSCSALTWLTSYVTQLQDIPASSFSTTTLNQVPLYVPSRYVSQYKKTTGWKMFKSIVPIEESIKGQVDEAYTPAIIDIPIHLVNAETDLLTLSAEVVLPEGFSLLMDENGNARYECGERLQEQTANITVTQTENGAYQLTVQIDSPTPTIDNEGIVLRLKAIASSDTPEGEYQGMIQNAQLTYDDDYTVQLGASSFGFQLKEALAGDVNLDGIVNITDVMLTVNHVIDSTPSVFAYPLADLNRDSQVTITDIMMLVNIIINAE